jgi:hypothetical protein
MKLTRESRRILRMAVERLRLLLLASARLARRLVCGDRPVLFGAVELSLPGGAESWRLHNNRTRRRAR